MHKLKVLICDDQTHVRIGHEDAIFQCGKGLFHPIVTEAKSGEEAIELVKEALKVGSYYDIVLMDFDFGQKDGATCLNGFQAVDQIHHLLPHAVIAMISAEGDQDKYDIVEKTRYIDIFFRRGEFDLVELKALCRYALVRGLHQRNELLPANKVAFTQAQAMKEYLDKIDQFSEIDSVFICGETGTGKELTAERLNANAKVFTDNPKRTLDTINCGGFTATLLMAELFGHVKGAYTGADRDREGWIEKSNGGDIFLDEFQNAPLDFQKALLRFLQSGEFSRVGESAVRKSKARVIIAFNEDPTEAMSNGKLRQDLFGRLQKNYIIIPPLRDRHGDVRALIAHFQSMMGTRDKKFAPDAIKFLESLPWKTNVRGVKAVVEASIERSRLPVITASAIRELPLVKELSTDQATSSELSPDETFNKWESKAADLLSQALADGMSFDEAVSAFEGAALKRSIKQETVLARIAQRLRLPQTNLRRKLVRHKLELAERSVDSTPQV